MSSETISIHIEMLLDYHPMGSHVNDTPCNVRNLLFQISRFFNYFTQICWQFLIFDIYEIILYSSDRIGDFFAKTTIALRLQFVFNKKTTTKGMMTNIFYNGSFWRCRSDQNFVQVWYDGSQILLIQDSSISSCANTVDWFITHLGLFTYILITFYVLCTFE
jgi:hypothetical protein